MRRTTLVIAAAAVVVVSVALGRAEAITLPAPAGLTKAIDRTGAVELAVAVCVSGVCVDVGGGDGDVTIGRHGHGDDGRGNGRRGDGGRKGGGKKGGGQKGGGQKGGGKKGGRQKGERRQQ